MEVRFSAYNENHKKRYVRNISILGNGGEKKEREKKKKSFFCGLPIKNCNAPATRQKIVVIAIYIVKFYFPLVFAYSLCDKHQTNK